MAGLWYRSGTIAVTGGSKKVVGTGTTWKSGVYKPDKGHLVWGPDGKPYELDYVESDTVLYLVTAYSGVTATGMAYSIDITRSSTIPAFSRELSAQLAYAQAQYDSWQQILTGSGMVTLTAPDGQQIQVPALSAFQPTSASLQALQDLVPAKDKLPVFNSATGADLVTLAPFMRTLLDDGNANEARKTLLLPNQGSFGRRNKLINGDMRVAQRGGSGTIPAGYHAYALDRWNVYSNNQPINWSQQGGPTGANGNSLYINGAASTDVIVRQRIEAKNCLDLNGASVTLSFYLYGSYAGGVSIVPSLNTPNSADNYLNITVIKTGPIIAVPGTTFTRYEVQFDALPTYVLNGLEVAFTSAGLNASAAFAIANVQLEVGEVATPFEVASYGDELILCQRYYEAGYFFGIGHVGLSAGQPLSPIQFAAHKRAVPTIAFSDITYANCNSLVASLAKTNTTWLIVTGTAASQAYAHGTFTANAEL